MQSKLNVALVQSHLVWENPEKNLKNFSAKIKNISRPVDVIVLPEMFTTGFSMNAPALAETMNGPTVAWMRQEALKANAAIVGSLIVKESHVYYNRLVFVFPSGKLEVYNKRHTFTLAGENKVYAKGTSKLIVDYKGWRICPLICYDLRFPVWARNTENYDILLYVANWPEPRIMAWDALLKARAIENMCYVVGVNRTGTDPQNNQYSGHSAIYDALGKPLACIKTKETTKVVTLDKQTIAHYRNTLGFLNDKDSFNLI